MILSAIVAGSLLFTANHVVTPFRVHRESPPTPKIEKTVKVRQCPASVLDAVVMVKPDRRPGFGSGFIISEDGKAITNAHVAKVSTDGTVVLETRNGKAYRADILKIDHEEDLALLQIRGGDKFPHLDLAERGALIGETSIQIGWSGKRLEQETLVFLGYCGSRWECKGTPGIEPGDSGGPIVNVGGEVIGVGSARSYTTLETFWVPLEDLKAFIDDHSSFVSNAPRLVDRNVLPEPEVKAGEDPVKNKPWREVLDV